MAVKNKTNIFFAIASILIIVIPAFIYRFITNFPIGDDPAVHIFTVKHSTYFDLLHTSYPLPLIIFKAVAQITHLPYPAAFIILICSFLFFAALALMLLVKKISGSNIIAIMSGLLFATGYWAYDGLRMGLLPETFGWFILLLTLYFLTSRKIIWTLIFTALLVLSHPFSLTIYALVFSIYLLTVLISGEKKDKIIVSKLFVAYLAAGIIAWLTKPELVHKFSEFMNPEKIGWGERSFWDFFTASQMRRVYISIFALIGVITTVRDWKKPGIKLVYALLFVGMFMSFNQIFGIRFLVFRFFPYFEIGFAIFAALGISNVAKSFNWSGKVHYILITAIMLIVIAPQIRANILITQNQAHSTADNNSMTVGDQNAITWIQQNIDHGHPLILPYKRQLWVLALTDQYNIISDETISQKQSFDFRIPDSYIYYPEIYPVPESVKQNLNKVYGKDGVEIYRVKECE